MNFKLQDKYIVYAIEILIVALIFTGNNYSSSDILTFIGTILGSLLGVLGACYIFSRQINNEKNNKRDVILEMLSYMLNKTEYLVDGYIDEVIMITENEGINRNWSKEEIENLVNESIIGIVAEAGFSDRSDKDFEEKKDIIYKKIRKMEKKNLNSDNQEFRDLHKLVYYKNWQESIIYIDSKFREDLIKWILYLEETKDIFSDMTSRYISNKNNSNSSKFNDLSDGKIVLNYQIYQFIAEREYLVEIMNNIYKGKKKFDTIDVIMNRGLSFKNNYKI